MTKTATFTTKIATLKDFSRLRRKSLVGQKQINFGPSSADIYMAKKHIANLLGCKEAQITTPFAVKMLVLHEIYN